MKLVIYKSEFSLYVFPRHEYLRLANAQKPGHDTIEICGSITKNDICMYKFGDGLIVYNLTRGEKGYIFDARYAMAFLNDVEPMRSNI